MGCGTGEDPLGIDGYKRKGAKDGDDDDESLESVGAGDTTRVGIAVTGGDDGKLGEVDGDAESRPDGGDACTFVDVGCTT